MDVHRTFSIMIESQRAMDSEISRGDERGNQSRRMVVQESSILSKTTRPHWTFESGHLTWFLESTVLALARSCSSAMIANDFNHAMPSPTRMVDIFRDVAFNLSCFFQ